MMQVQYTINGKPVSKEEWDKHGVKRVRMHGGLSRIFSDRKAPGGHEPYWGTGHVCTSGGVPSSQAAGLAAWVEAEGLQGVEVLPDGDVKFSSPESMRKYAEARKLTDAGNAGSGECKGQHEHEWYRDVMNSKPTGPSEHDKEVIRQQAEELAHHPKIRAIVERNG